MKKLQHILFAGTSLHLRAPFLALTPILPILQAYFGITHAETGLLSTLPLLLFASVSPFVSVAAARYGMPRLFALGLLLISVGTFIRSYTDLHGLYGGTILLSGGIAIANVLLPSFIKGYYAHHEGAATGAFVTLMNGMNAVMSIAIVPLTLWLGWQAALGFWSVTALVWSLLWLAFPQQATTQQQSHSYSLKEVFRHSAAWWVTLYLGTQSLVYFALVTWLPYWVLAKGMTTADAGFYAFLFQLTGLPFSFLAPLFATGPRRQWLAVAICILYILGFIGIFVTRGTWWLTFSVALIGIAAGACFSLCTLAFSLRSASPLITSRMTGLGQALGYSLAALGPVGIGILYEWVGSWPPLLFAYLIACFFLTFFAWKAMAFGKIGEV